MAGLTVAFWTVTAISSALKAAGFTGSETALCANPTDIWAMNMAAPLMIAIADRIRIFSPDSQDTVGLTAQSLRTKQGFPAAGV
jgi:hypothetical protein